MIALLIILPLLIGLFSAYLTNDYMNSYGQLNRPPLSPPGTIFPIVWTILYLLMGIASAIVYTSQDSRERTLGLTLHFVQLILNFFWSIIFFRLKEYFVAFIWLVLLWLAVFSMITNYRKFSKSAFLLDVPYLCWLTFAGYLNLAVFILN